MKKISSFFLAIMCTMLVHGQLNVKFDFSNIDQTTAFFKKENASNADIDNMLASPGVKVIIRKIRSSDSIARLALYNVSHDIKTSKKENDFQYGQIKAGLKELEQFSELIKTNRQVIMDSVKSLEKYLPEGKTMDVTVSFLAGGYSAGFTMGDDNIFYVGTHQYKNDFVGIVNTCQHELFHNIQSMAYDRNATLKKLQDAKEMPALYFAYIGNNLFVEGSAEYIADMEKMGNATPFMKSQLEHAAVNKSRMEDNFYLIENILMAAYREPEKADGDISYRILFDWNWNNPGYAAGKYMCKALVSKYGEMVMKKYLTEDPMVFIRDYILLAKSDSKSFPYHFSEDFEKTVNIVLEKINATKK